MGYDRELVLIHPATDFAEAQEARAIEPQNGSVCVLRNQDLELIKSLRPGCAGLRLGLSLFIDAAASVRKCA